MPAIVFFPMWLTGVVGLIGCACSSRSNCLRWLGVFLLPFVMLPLVIARQWLREGSVSGEIRRGRYGPVTGDFNIARAERPLAFGLMIALFAAASLGVLVVSVLLLCGYWQLK